MMEFINYFLGGLWWLCLTVMLICYLQFYFPGWVRYAAWQWKRLKRRIF